MEFNLFIKPSKCTFDANQIEFFSFIVGQTRISIDSAKLDLIAT